MADLAKRDIEDTIWSVFTSFGFTEEDEENDKQKYFILDKNEARIKNTVGNMAKAETAAALIEAGFACGINDFSVEVSDKEVYDLLVLFGFENILKQSRDIKNGFSVIADNIKFGFGAFESEKSTAVIEIDNILKACKNADIEGNASVSKSLVFAEKNAEGLSYDVCYNLRVNGCIVEMYCEDGDIKKACEYAEKEGHSCILRCFPDGVLEIKDIAKNEITKTTVSDFLGYYEEDLCDCVHEHHHGEECNCQGEHHHRSCSHMQ